MIREMNLRCHPAVKTLLISRQMTRYQPTFRRPNMPRLREFLPRNAKYSTKEDSWLISYRQKKSLVAFDFQLDDKTTHIQTTFICSWP
jgi:hypothetical protein